MQKIKKAAVIIVLIGLVFWLLAAMTDDVNTIRKITDSRAVKLAIIGAALMITGAITCWVIDYIEEKHQPPLSYYLRERDKHGKPQ